MAGREHPNPIVTGENFRPAPQLKALFYAYLALSIAVLVLPYMVPLILFAPSIVAAAIAIPTLALIIFTAAWIPLYYETVVYHVTDSEISWKRGIWFRQTGIVPYTRITNIDIIQGPIMRALGISTLRIQTAGYSGQAAAELRLQGIEEPEALRELIMGFVRGSAPVATGTYAETASPEMQLLQEVREIKRLLEMRAGGR